MSSDSPILAIDLGGSRIKIGVVIGSEVTAFRTLAADSQRGLAAALPRIEAACAASLAEAEVAPSELRGCGVAYAGLVDPAARRIVGSNGKYEDGAAVDLPQWAADRWGTDCVLDNDARLACVGEWQFGAGRGSNDLVTVTLGTGIGTGVIIGGRVLRGKHFRAGNLGGHVPLAVHGDVICSCGNRNCAEALASTWAIRRDLAAAPRETLHTALASEPVGYRELFQAAKDGNRPAIELVEHSLATWSTLVVALIHAYDPDTVVLTGNVTNAAEIILPAIVAYVERYAWLPTHRVAIKIGRYPNVAALLGAAYLITLEERDATV